MDNIRDHFLAIKYRDYLFCIYKRSKLLTDFKSYKKFQNHLTPCQGIS